MAEKIPQAPKVQSPTNQLLMTVVLLIVVAILVAIFVKLFIGLVIGLLTVVFGVGSQVYLNNKL